MFGDGEQLPREKRMPFAKTPGFDKRDDLSGTCFIIVISALYL